MIIDHFALPVHRFPLWIRRRTLTNAAKKKSAFVSVRQRPNMLLYWFAAQFDPQLRNPE
jgi:hypothetical protein